MVASVILFSTDFDLVVKPFSTKVPLLYLLKTLINQRSFDVFRGYRSKTLAENRLTDYLKTQPTTQMFHIIVGPETDSEFRVLDAFFRKVKCYRPAILLNTNTIKGVLYKNLHISQKKTFARCIREIVWAFCKKPQSFSTRIIKTRF